MDASFEISVLAYSVNPLALNVTAARTYSKSWAVAQTAMHSRVQSTVHGSLAASLEGEQIKVSVIHVLHMCIERSS